MARALPNGSTCRQNARIQSEVRTLLLSLLGFRRGCLFFFFSFFFGGGRRVWGGLGGALPPQQAGKRSRSADLDFARARGGRGGGVAGRASLRFGLYFTTVLYLPSVLAVAGKAQMSHPLRQILPDQFSLCPGKAQISRPCHRKSPDESSAETENPGSVLAVAGKAQMSHPLRQESRISFRCPRKIPDESSAATNNPGSVVLVPGKCQISAPCLLLALRARAM